MRNRRLPPLNPLKAFEAAARHNSFTGAAEELNVSAVAVGRQVSVLEQYLGTSLFDRENRRIRLTSAAQDYLPAVSAALDLLDEATANFRRVADQTALTVCTYPSFALNWLVPRLSQFRSSHPDIEINVITGVDKNDFDYQRIDIGIQFSHVVPPEILSDPLLSDVIQPVCSPELLEGDHPPVVPDNLRHHTLLRSMYRPHDWRDWLQGIGYDEITPRQELTFTGSGLTYQAAISGLGIAIAQRVLVAQDVSGGQLVAPFSQAIQLTSDYCLAVPEERCKDRRIRAFRDWIQSQAEQSRVALGLPKVGAQEPRLIEFDPV